MQKHVGNRKVNKSFFLLAIVFLALVLAGITTSSSLAQTPTDTPVPSVTPTVGGVDPFPTKTSTVQVNYPCPSGVPGGYGTLTPSGDWDSVCAPCLGAPTVTPTVTATGTLATSTPGSSQLVCESAGCVQVNDTTVMQHFGGEILVSTHPQVVIEMRYHRTSSVSAPLYVYYQVEHAELQNTTTVGKNVADFYRTTSNVNLHNYQFPVTGISAGMTKDATFDYSVVTASTQWLGSIFTGIQLDGAIGVIYRYNMDIYVSTVPVVFNPTPTPTATVTPAPAVELIHVHSEFGGYPAGYGTVINGVWSCGNVNNYSIRCTGAGTGADSSADYAVNVVFQEQAEIQTALHVPVNIFYKYSVTGGHAVSMWVNYENPSNPQLVSPGNSGTGYFTLPVSVKQFYVWVQDSYGLEEINSYFVDITDFQLATSLDNLDQTSNSDYCEVIDDGDGGGGGGEDGWIPGIIIDPIASCKSIPGIDVDLSTWGLNYMFSTPSITFCVRGVSIGSGKIFDYTIDYMGVLMVYVAVYLFKTARQM